MSTEDFTDFEIQVSTEDVNAWGGEQRPLVPPGSYLLTVTGMKQKPADSGNTVIEVEFTVAEGDCVGQKVWNNYALTDKAMGRVKQLQVACKTELGRIVASQFMGQTIRAEIMHTEGKARVDQNGNPMPIRTFANVINEQPLEEVAAEKPATKQPPVLQGKAAGAPPNGAKATTAPRRA